MEVILYSYDPMTKEIVRNVDGTVGFVAVPDPEVPDAVIRPAYSTDVKPEAYKAGYVQCFDTAISKWVQVEDHRGHFAFSIEDASPFMVTTLGEIPKGYTLLTPCEFPKWDGAKWVIDTVAQATAAQKSTAIEAAKTLAAKKLDYFKTTFPDWASLKADIETVFTDASQRKLMLRLGKAIYWMARETDV